MIQDGRAEADFLKCIIARWIQAAMSCRKCFAGVLGFIKLRGHVGRKIFVLVPVFSVFLWHSFSPARTELVWNRRKLKSQIPPLSRWGRHISMAVISPAKLFSPGQEFTPSFPTRFSLEWAAEVLSILTTCKTFSWHLCFYPDTEPEGCSARGGAAATTDWLPDASGLNRAQSWDPQVLQFVGTGSKSLIKD